MPNYYVFHHAEMNMTVLLLIHMVFSLLRVDHRRLSVFLTTKPSQCWLRHLKCSLKTYRRQQIDSFLAREIQKRNWKPTQDFPSTRAFPAAEHDSELEILRKRRFNSEHQFVEPVRWPLGISQYEPITKFLDDRQHQISMVAQIRREVELQQVHNRCANYIGWYIFDFEKLGTQSQHVDRTYIITLLVRNETKFGFPASAVGTYPSSLLGVAISSERHHRLPSVQFFNRQSISICGIVSTSACLYAFFLLKTPTSFSSFEGDRTPSYRAQSTFTSLSFTSSFADFILQFSSCRLSKETLTLSMLVKNIWRFFSRSVSTHTDLTLASCHGHRA